ncbi:hypothetical protein TCDM_10674 [Trypanosoma cruzi Dm28c]|uniref:Uncharacterized protein n=1 Tax=Trypanosoma cruzi Dm28c TaxID=1416333 RepID=V5D2L6_TRYCR|nr:hypothetical protein TCDM_10674 [Trypanosoma cruzi Dm28c]
MQGDTHTEREGRVCVRAVHGSLTHSLSRGHHSSSRTRNNNKKKQKRRGGVGDRGAAVTVTRRRRVIFVSGGCFYCCLRCCLTECWNNVGIASFKVVVLFFRALSIIFICLILDMITAATCRGR